MHRHQLSSFTALCLPLLLLLVFTAAPTGANSKSSASSASFAPLEERVQQLTDLTQSRASIRFNPERFRSLVGYKGVGQPVRNYSVVVLFTAVSAQRGCSVCRMAADEFAIAANSWRYSAEYADKQLFFGVVDFDVSNGGEVFSSLGINSAPLLLFYGPRERQVKSFSLKSGQQMDIQRMGFSAEAIARWSSDRAGIKAFRITRPSSYTNVVLAALVVIMVGGLLYNRRHDLSFLGNKTAWAVISLAIVLVMTSGQMWNHIRGAPFVQRTADGGVAFIHGSSSGQFVVETHIIFALNLVIAGGFICLIEAMKPKGASSGAGKAAGKALGKKTAQFLAVVGLLLVAVFFSWMMSIFRAKSPGYPYSFLFK